METTKYFIFKKMLRDELLSEGHSVNNKSFLSSSRDYNHLPRIIRIEYASNRNQLCLFADEYALSEKAYECLRIPSATHIANSRIKSA